MKNLLHRYKILIKVTPFNDEIYIFYKWTKMFGHRTIKTKHNQSDDLIDSKL